MTGDTDLQGLCEQGQQLLMATDYLAAERALVRAEALALEAQDLDTLGRLYFPLQETRRQKRQVCGDGTVRLDLIAQSQHDHVEARHAIEHYPHGQLLIAGWGTIEPAVELRRLAHEQGLYVETFLAAVYPVGEQRMVAVVPTADVSLPPVEIAAGGDVAALIRRLPPFSVLLGADELPKGARAGDSETFARTMGLWEQLHLPFLNNARQVPDPMRRIEAYRQAIRVDDACEKAHQWLAETAMEEARRRQREWAG